jgi:hypothetical protein
MPKDKRATVESIPFELRQEYTRMPRYDDRVPDLSKINANAADMVGRIPQESIDVHFADAWLACDPLIKAALGR